MRAGTVLVTLSAAILLLFTIPVLDFVPTLGAGLLVIAALEICLETIAIHVLGNLYNADEKRTQTRRAVISFVVAAIACIPWP